MKISKLLYSIFLGFTIYSILFFIEGDTGLKAMEKVESYKEQLNLNLEDIRSINNELIIDFDSLSSDNEIIKLKARALGYFDKADHIIHIASWNPNIDEYNPGHVIKEEYLTEIKEGKFRVAWLFVSLSAYSFFLLKRRMLRFNK